MNKYSIKNYAKLKKVSRPYISRLINNGKMIDGKNQKLQTEIDKITNRKLVLDSHFNDLFFD